MDHLIAEHYFAVDLTVGGRPVPEERFRTLQGALTRVLDFPGADGWVTYHRAEVSAGQHAMRIHQDGTWEAISEARPEVDTGTNQAGV